MRRLTATLIVLSLTANVGFTAIPNSSTACRAADACAALAPAAVFFTVLGQQTSASVDRCVGASARTATWAGFFAVLAGAFWYLSGPHTLQRAAFGLGSLIFLQSLWIPDALADRSETKWKRQRAWLLSRSDSLEFIRRTGLLPTVAYDIWSMVKKTPYVTLQGLDDFLRQSKRNPLMIIPKIIAGTPEETPERAVRVRAPKSATSPPNKKFDRYLHEEGVQLTSDEKHVPSVQEKRVIVDLLNRLAVTAHRRIDLLDVDDYRRQIPLAPGKELRLYEFFKDMARINTTPFKTETFILIRYGVLPDYGLSNIAEFKHVVTLNVLRRDPWPYLSDSMQIALIRELSHAVKKPPLWLTTKDYSTVPLPALSTPEQPFTLRNYYLSVDRMQDERDAWKIFAFIRLWPLPFFKLSRLFEPAMLVRLKALGMVDRQLSVQHPIQTVGTPAELNVVLENGWLRIGSIPWDYVRPSVQCDLIRELAKVSGKPIAKLTARDFEDVPIPSLTLTSRGIFYDATLRGLYQLYYDHPLRLRTPTPAFILLQLGLVTPDQVMTTPRRPAPPRIKQAV